MAPRRAPQPPPPPPPPPEASPPRLAAAASRAAAARTTTTAPPTGNGNGNAAGPPRPATPLLPVLALMNGSALLALTLLVVWPATFTLTQQVVALLAMWLLVNLLAVVLVRLIDSGRNGAAAVNLSKDQATLRVSVEDAPPKK